MNATERMGVWVATHSGDMWSAMSREGARRGFMDTVAVILAGATEAPPRSVHAAVARWGSGMAWVVTGGRLAAPWAALINGTAAHAQDYDDVLNPAMSHPSAALVPAILALAEEEKLSGAACIDAYLTGFEIMTRLGEGMNLAHYRKGWHTTLSIGAIGVAAACARLLGLNARAAQMSLSLSTSMAGGSKQQFGTAAKPLHAGLAAKNGIMAARLAQAGIDAAQEAFEGPWGYINQTTGPEAPGLSATLDRLGTAQAMEQHGLWLKHYPCCASTHRPLDALRTLMREGLTAPEIEAIDVRVSEVAFANLRYRAPATPSEARFSLPYCLAAALQDDLLTGTSFSEAALQRPEVRHMLPRIHLQADPAMTYGLERGEGARVEVQMKSGRVLVRQVDVPHGHPLDPLTDAELAAKFSDCASALPPGRIRQASAALTEMAVLADLSALTEPLSAA